MKEPVPQEVCLRLRIRPETAEQPWHATLEDREGSGRLEFDSPLELARHLAQVGHLEPRGKLR
ncbi:hypothetical protein [Calidithermus chliarophilus]|uniref:hypothetical protein n=1 Tax=Calidithermus chliarophilus TaxID=52023 RepID=UPI0012F6AE18|nr:hypothetical protein [Calidithermus chliarophilus]